MDGVEAEIRGDDSRRDERELDPGVFAAHLHAEVRRERVEKVLRAIVGRADQGEGDAPQHGRDVDDVSRAPLLEVRKHLLHAVEGALHVVADHRVDVVVGQLRGKSRDPAPHVVDPHVDVAEVGEGRIDDALHLGTLGHVARP